jgi:hypothetical protein
MMGTPAMSRRMAMLYARGFYSGRIRSRVKVTPGGTLHIIEANGKVVGSGYSWAMCYENLRANLPLTPEGDTDFAALDAKESR